MSYTEKRRHKRINYRVNAEIRYDAKHFKGVIENFSHEGIFKIVFPEKSVIDFYPEEALEISFTYPPKDTFNLDCRIKWVRIKRENPLFLKYQLGVQIIKPSPEYKDFVKNLLMKTDI